MRIKEFTGKTTQEAIDNGLAELGVTIADVHVDVLQEGAKGLFGLFGSKPACVRLTVMDDEREDDHGLSDLLGSFSLNEQKKKSVPKPAAPKPAAPKAEAPKPEAKPDAPKAEAKPEMKPEKKPEKKPEAKPAAPKAEVKPEAPKAETKPEKKPEAPKPPRERKPRPTRPARGDVRADRAARHPSGGHPGGTRAEIPDGRDRPHGRQGGRLCGRQQGG